MVFHIAICSADLQLRARLEQLCMDYYSRRADSCIVEQLPDTAALLRQDEAGARYELYLLELSAALHPEGLAAAAALRSRGCRAPLAFLARTPTHAYSAYRVDAMQYLLLPIQREELFALLDRATEPEYGPVLALASAQGLHALPYADIEYLECTHHVVHAHLRDGGEVASLSLRIPFSAVAAPLLEDERFIQPHRSYVVNLSRVQLMAAGELRMGSGARIPVPRSREPELRAAFRRWLETNQERRF
ncbi:MAG: LytR/AlgR family response regulator transcription factor [Faecalibacterium sp.]